MKHTFKILTIAAFLIIAPLKIFSQDNPPPHPGGDPTKTGGTPVGQPAGAPIGNGTFILFALAAAYAGRKIYMQRNTEEETA